MTDKELDNNDDTQVPEEYLASLEEQILAILNGVKEELGVDTPVNIEVRQVDEDE